MEVVPGLNIYQLMMVMVMMIAKGKMSLSLLSLFSDAAE